MLRIITFLSLFLPFLLSAQLQPDKTIYDHGVIASFNNDTAWFTFSNTGSKSIYLLPTMPSDEYAVLCSSKEIEAGGSILMGIVYYTDKKGRFEVNIPLYFSHSNKALEIKVKGDIKSVRETALNVCPSIENSKPLQPSQIPLKITVRDLNTGVILSQVKVDVKRGQRLYTCVPGMESRSYKCNLPYGPLLINASRKHYSDTSMEAVYDDKNYDFVLFLRPVTDTVKLYKKPVLITQKEQQKDSFSQIIPVYVPVAYADSGFNSYRYRPNHLIFIIDISGSMKDSGKLNYLKRSMKELLAIIRPGDHITLITYTNKVRVVFENKSGLERSEIEKAIDTLKAGGGSNGSQSLVIAYELARKYFITGGNNQVFIATDGLLNSSKMTNEDLYRLAAKAYRQHGIILSAIGFGNDAAALGFLEKLARSGRGNYLRILNPLSDMQTLVNEVKLQSLRKD